MDIGTYRDIKGHTGTYRDIQGHTWHAGQLGVFKK